MTQSIFGGATSYEEQSLNDIKDDVSLWIKYAKDTYDELNFNLSKAKESGYWENVSYDFQSTIISSIRYFITIIDDLGLVLDAINNKRISKRDVILLRKIGTNAVHYNKVEYPESYNGTEDTYWKRFGDKEFEPIENMYCTGRDFFITLQDARNAASRLEDYIMKENIINNTVNIVGDGNKTQVQQGNNNTMNLEYQGFNYDKALEVLLTLKKINDEEFNSIFKDNVEEIKKEIEEVIKLCESKKSESKVTSLLKKIMNIVSNIGNNLIVGGIVDFINENFPMV